MDADINRWRNMGATKSFHYPNERIALVPSRPDRFHGLLQKRQATIGLLPRPKPEPLKSILDRFTKSQHQDIVDYTSGYMNPNKINREYQKRIEPSGKIPVIFGKNKVENERPEIGEMISILQQFDTVGDKVEPVNQPKEHKEVKRQPFCFQPKRFLPDGHLSLTKQQKFEAIAKIDTNLIRPGKSIRHTDTGKQDLLRKLQHFVQHELKINNCPPVGPHHGRLEVYSACFDQIIKEFKSFGPILAEIKQEYDRTIESFRIDEQEFQFLRTKVQKLLSQNENRALLKYEKQKCKELQEQIVKLNETNQKLRDEMVYKIAVYASYLPESVLGEFIKSDAQSKTGGKFPYGKDPISVRDQTIAEQETQLRQQMEEITKLRKQQETEYVPRITKEKIEENLRNLEEKHKHYVDTANKQEAQINLLRNQVRTLESNLREKEQQYQFLVSEYRYFKLTKVNYLNR